MVYQIDLRGYILVKTISSGDGKNKNTNMRASFKRMEEMAMKKRWKWIFFGGFFAVFIIVAVCLIIFLSKTISPGNEAEEYCIKNTAINATSFDVVGYMEHDEGNWTRYIYWIAEDGLSDRQELFIFQQVQFGPMGSSMKWNRFRFPYHVSSGEDEIVGSVTFTPHDMRNRDLSVDWMIFYSSNEHHISRYTFTVEEDGKTYTTKDGMVSTDQAFAVTLPDLGVKDGVSRKFVKAEFFDAQGKLVETIEGNE